MNDHIKRCILDAGFPKFDKMYVVSDGEELEKFAQLIVQECAEVGKQSFNRGLDMAVSPFALPQYIESKIKEHFGVSK